MTLRLRLRWSLAVAVVAHGLAIVLAPKSGPSGGSKTAGPPIEVEIEPSPPPPNPVEPPPVEPPPESAPPVVATHVAPTALAPRDGNPASPASEEPVAVPVASAAPGDNSSWTFAPTTSSAQAAGDAAARTKAFTDATSAGVGVVVAEATKKAAERARKPLIFTPQDLELGIVPGGQFASLARDRVRNSITALNGHALLEFWTDKRGIVARVRVLSVSSDEKAWDELAETLAEDARSKFPLKIPSNADGLIVTLDITSALKRLSGQSANQGSLMRALEAIQNPIDAVIDSKASPQRVVAAKVVSVEAF